MRELFDHTLLPLPPVWRKRLHETQNSPQTTYLNIPNFHTEVCHMFPPPYHSLFLYCHAIVGHQLFAGHHTMILNPDYLSLRLVVKGCEYIRYDHHLYLFEEGDLMMFLPHHSFEYATKDNQPCSVRSIAIKGNLLESILEHSQLKNRCFLHPKSHDFFLESFQQLCQQVHDSNEDAPVKHASVIFQLLQTLEEPFRQPDFPPQLHAMLRFADTHLDHPVTLLELSQIGGCSPTTVNCLFRRHLHCSPHDYILRNRMRRAHDMLQRQLFSVKETAAILGFSSQFNFSTQFRKFFGYPPKECLDKHSL